MKGLEVGFYKDKRPTELESLALTLLEDWRNFLIESDDPGRSRNGTSDYGADPEAPLERFIDIVEGTSTDFLLDHPDEELSHGLRLVFELDYLLTVIGGDREGEIVRDAVAASMSNLASIMRRRGYATTLPTKRPR